jgi:GR25 family glycosyltransferase involved in LPS biosynthesis
MIRICFIILLIICLLFISYKKREGFDNQFVIYVITLKNEDRIINIKVQQEKIDVPIHIFDAVNGNNIDLKKVDNLKPDNNFIKNEKQKKKEIGCYLSHLNIYKMCKKSGYTIVFEDDFSIDVDNLIDRINNSIDKLNKANIDFDIMYLGNHPWNESHGNNIIDDLYKVGNNEGLGGTHSYVINNKNIDKIIQEFSIIDRQIDMNIQHLANEGKINVIKTYPYYVTTIESPSTIATGENFSNYII